MKAVYCYAGAIALGFLLVAGVISGCGQRRTASSSSGDDRTANSALAGGGMRGMNPGGMGGAGGGMPGADSRGTRDMDGNMRGTGSGEMSGMGGGMRGMGPSGMSGMGLGRTASDRQAGDASASAASGKSVFGSNCVACHGRKGGEIANWRAKVRKMTVTQVQRAIRNGTKRMPPYSKTLSAQQIQSAADYAKKLANSSK